MESILEEKDIKKLAALLAESERIVLTCHVRPDGDAVGSTLGLWHLLKKLGKAPTVIVPDQIPRSLSFLPGIREVAVYTVHEEYCRRVIDEADLIICCDFNKPSRQDRLGPLIEGASCPKVMIDHHQFPDSFCDITFSRPEMSSASELAFRVIAALGLYPDLDQDSATCLLTGIITDTRNFSVNCSNPEIYEVLMRLMEKGADKIRIVREALQTRSYWSLKLEAYALSEKMELFAEHCCCVTTLDEKELERFHYERGDTEGLVNRPLEIRGVVYSFFLRQDKDCVKVSARSQENFPVSEICERLYGGGGHRQAAGAEFKGSLEECRRMLVEAMKDYDKYLPSRREKIEM